MVSSAKRTKMALPMSEDHSKECKRHDDIDERETRCNNILNDGDRCRFKVKLRSTDPTMLSLCGVHSRHPNTNRKAHCIAQETCGRRCNRICRWDTGLKPVCSLHESQSLPCFWNRMPTELRFAIIYVLIPEGDISHDQTRGLYASVPGLARVNKETWHHLDALLYSDPKRTCHVHVMASTIRTLGLTFGHNLRVRSYYRREARSMLDLHHAGLARFGRIKLHVEAGVFLLTSVAVTIHHLMNAMTRLAAPHWQAKYGKRKLILSIHGNLDLPWHKASDTIVALFRGVNHVLSIMKMYNFMVTWQFNITVVGGREYLMPYKRVKVIATFSDVKSEALHGDLTAEYKQLIGEVKALRLSAWLLLSHEWTKLQNLKWTTYTRIVTTLRDLYDLGCVTLIKPEDIQTFFEYVQRAFAVGDNSALDLLAESLHAQWADFALRENKKLQSLRDRHSGATQDWGAATNARYILQKKAPPFTLSSIMNQLPAQSDLTAPHTSHHVASPECIVVIAGSFLKWSEIVSFAEFKARSIPYESENRTYLIARRDVAHAAAQRNKDQSKLSWASKPVIDVAIKCAKDQAQMVQNRLLKNTHKQSQITSWVVISRKRRT